MLESLQKRIKGSRLILGRDNRERLFFSYGKNNKIFRTCCWFEVVNDRLKVFAKVENLKASNKRDINLQSQYSTSLNEQFYEIINNCEAERKKTPLNERLSDDIIPIYDDSSLKHQAQALRFLCSMKVSALFADTGVGKSKIAIDLCQSRFEAGQIRKVLVLCPVSTIKNFKDQIKKWCVRPEIEWKAIGIESLSSSLNAVSEATSFIDSETQLIVDESHYCKTPFSKRSMRVFALSEKTSYKIIMTGTPTEGAKDIYMQYAILSELITETRSYFAFEKKYLIIGGRNMDEIIGYKNVDHLMGLIEPYTYQITAEECLDLPAKVFRTVTCKLNDLQQEKYDIEKENLLTLIQNEEYVSESSIFRAFTLLQQISCGYYRNKDGETEDLGTNKLDLLHKTRYDCGQTVFFCKYIFEVNLLINFLGAENCVAFTGLNRKTRDFEKDLFTSGQKKYFVATMSSGGVGLNGLQICQRVVFFSNSFKYSERKQCIGRIDRQGQVGEMDIYDIQTTAGIDNQIIRNLNRKGNLAEEIKYLLLDKTKLKQYVQDL